VLAVVVRVLLAEEPLVVLAAAVRVPLATELLAR
jgi:hypothetical protein